MKPWLRDRKLGYVTVLANRFSNHIGITKHHKHEILFAWIDVGDDGVNGIGARTPKAISTYWR